MLNSTQIELQYNGRLTQAKRLLIDYLERDGYQFLANDFRTMDTAKKWEHADLVQIAAAHKARPRYLWAIRKATNEVS
jgi:hypothetical protein